MRKLRNYSFANTFAFCVFFIISTIFYTSLKAQTYCTPSYNNPCAQTTGGATNDVIHSFSTLLGITNITNTNTGCNSYCAGNLTVWPATTGNFLTVARGQQFRVVVAGEATGSATFQQGYAVWVDWNRNGVFQPAELVYGSPVGFGPFTSPLITVPNSALCGPTRMRVRSVFAQTPNDPCGNAAYGETEDYVVYVISNPETPPATAADTSLCRGGNITITAQCSDPGTIAWFNSVNGMNPITTGPSITLTNVQQATTIYVQNTLNNCSSKRHPVRISLGYNRGNMIAEDTVYICAPDTALLEGIVSVQNIQNYGQQYTNHITQPCQRIIPDDYIGRPGSFFRTYFDVSGIYPLTINPAQMALEEVGIRINHTRARDIDAWLIAPNGSIIQLILNATNQPTTGPGFGTGTTPANYTYCKFRADNFLPVYNTANLPANQAINGTYRPQQPFTNLTGPNNGIWTLRVGDRTSNTNTGTFLSGYIKFRALPPDSTVDWLPYPALSSMIDSSFTGTANLWVNPNEPTDYILRVTDVPGCISYDTVHVRAGTTPQISFTPDPVNLCLGQSVQILVNGVDSARWSPLVNPGGANIVSYIDSVNVSITPQTINDNSFTVIGKSDIGCRDTVQFNINVYEVPPTPTISVSGPTTFCQGGSVTLTASNAASYLWSNGETTQSITVDSPGNYSVTITNANGCTSLPSAAVNVTVNPGPGVPQISSSGPLAFCEGGNVTLSGPAGFTYQWNTGQTSQSINVNQTGSYVLTITDANGCVVNSLPANVTVNPNPTQPVIQASGPLTFCNGNQVTLSAPAGFSYLWSNGATTQSIDVSTTGIFSVQITDANNCISPFSNNTSVVVNPLPAAPNITSQGGLTQICQGASLALTSSPGISYNWSTGQTGQTIIVNQTGSYSVSITDINGCTSAFSLPFDLVVNPLPDEPIIAASGPLSFCNGNTVTLTAPVAETYLWNTGATTQSITVNSSGTFSVSVTNQFGCVSPVSQQTFVTVWALPTISISALGPLTFCDGGSVVLQANANNGSILWQPTGEVTQSITAVSSGNYSATITDANGCVSNPSNTIVVNELPIPPAPVITSTTPVICQGGFVTLTTTPGQNYLWSNGSTEASITTNIPGTYTVSIIDNNGCPSPLSNPINLVVNPLPPTPAISSSGSLQFCDGENVTLIAPGGYQNYIWTPSGANAQTNIVENSGVYILQVVDFNGCTSLASAPVVVTEYPLPPPPIILANGSASFCNGESVELSLNSINVTYLWSTGETTQSIVATETGAYTATVTDFNGCTSPQSNVFFVTELPIPDAPVITPLSPTTFCEGGNVTLVSSFGVSYTWYPGGQTSQSITVNTSGNYSVSAIDVFGCPTPVSDVTLVNVLPVPASPIVTADGETTFCNGNNVNLTSSAPANNRWNTGELTQTINVANSGNYFVQVEGDNGCFSLPSNVIDVVVNPIPPAPWLTNSGPLSFCRGDSVVLKLPAAVSYLWNTGATSSEITVSESGTYTVVVVDQCNITHTLSANVTVFERPQLDFFVSDSTGCAPLKIVFNNQSTNVATVIWDFGDGKSSTQFSPTHYYSVPGENSVSLFAVSPQGCSARLSKPYLINVLPTPVADFQTSPEEIKFSKPEVELLDLSSDDVVDWKWRINNLVNLYGENVTYSFKDTGTYKIRLIVTNDLGCKDTTIKEIRVKGDLILYVPNAFTPNGDGYNETFRPKGTFIEAKKYKMTIFDRWGEVLFVTDQLSEGWNGTLENGISAPTGVYTWQIEATDMTGQNHILQGMVTLIY